MAQRRILSVSARAFVSPRKGIANRGITWDEVARSLEKEGGNPVTIFYPFHADTSEAKALRLTERTALAKSCAWESIIIEPHNDSSETQVFRFFMPSGEEVSFCGHAAIGASAFVANKQSMLNVDNFMSANIDAEMVTLPFVTADSSHYNSRIYGNQVELIMNVQHEELDCAKIHNAPSVDDILNQLGLNSNDLLTNPKWPTYINASVARPKTLIPIKSVDRLNDASPPKDSHTFRDICDSIDSTGVYLYAKNSISESSFECRQFPRASGYSEDPATGIAAGALAASLYKMGIARDCYTIYQGIAMGRPSNIMVKIESYNDVNVKLSYTGLVVLDSVSCLDNC
eukprot:scaffold236806_cov119-Cyclotella_meneghiniana.AAC.2